MDKAKIIGLLLVIALLVVGYWFYQTWTQKQPISTNQQNQATQDLCSADADCPFSEECFGEQTNRCVASQDGYKECTCIYASCESDSDCKDDFVCRADPGDIYGKKCYYNGPESDEGLDSSGEVTGQLLATSAEVESFIREKQQGNDANILQQCQGDISIISNGPDWDIVCSTDQGELTIVMGAYGDIVDYSTN